jgi:hypothetical protein
VNINKKITNLCQFSPVFWEGLRHVRRPECSPSRSVRRPKNGKNGKNRKMKKSEEKIVTFVLRVVALNKAFSLLGRKPWFSP